MKEKIKTMFIGILIGLIAFPSITLGGTFVVSLIQGKTVEEAIQILAEQIDTLIGRVEVLEVKQSKSELWQEKEDICNKARDYLIANMPTGYDWFLTTISHRERDIVSLEAQIRLPACQQCSEDDEECKNLVKQQYNNNECITDESKESSTHILADRKADLERFTAIKEQYLLFKQECDELTVQYDSLVQQIYERKN